MKVIAYYATAEMEIRDGRALATLLQAMAPQEEVAFIIQSFGGSPDAAHHLSSLLREYTQHLHVYVPTFAYSAATLFAISADTLWMGPTSELSPIDPQVPIDPRLLFPMAPMADPKEWGLPPGDPVHIPAHVIRDFLELAGVIEPTGDAASRPRLHEKRLDALLKPLNPWILGWYERADKVSRVYGREGLVNHLLLGIDETERERRADLILDSLLDYYASHGASIFRTQARRIGLPIQDLPDKLLVPLENLSATYRDAFDANIGRVLETTEGFHAIPDQAMRMCQHCDEAFEIDPTFRFCPHCGKNIAVQCASCSELMAAGWKYCPRCGAQGSA